MHHQIHRCDWDKGSQALFVRCVLEVFASEVCEVFVSHLQETNLLRPFRDHPAHVLTNGMLIHRSPNAFRTVSDGVMWCNVCDSCTLFYSVINRFLFLWRMGRGSTTYSFR